MAKVLGDTLHIIQKNAEKEDQQFLWWPTLSLMTKACMLLLLRNSILFLKSRSNLLKITSSGLKISKFLKSPGHGESTRRYLFHTIQTKRLKKRTTQNTFWFNFLSSMVNVVHLHANVMLSRRSILSKQINRGEDKPPSYTWPAWWLCNKRFLTLLWKEVGSKIRCSN